MRVCVDARKIRDFGIGQYIHNILLAMLRQDDVPELHLLFSQPQDRELLPEHPQVTFACLKAKGYSLKEQALMPLEIRRCRPDLVHIPHYNIPLLAGKPLIATVHDLIHLRFPGQVPSWIARMYAWFMFRAVARRCSAIIAISDCTEIDLMQWAGAPPDKVRVITYGRDPRFSPIPSLLKGEGKDGGGRPDMPGVPLEDKVLLVVGNCKPHKNVELLMDALALIPGNKPCKLVIAGGEPESIERLKTYAGSRKVSEWVVFLGPVSHDRIPSLYRQATALGFPSLYEGFGLPPLEAMASGLPVLASTAASIPAVVGDAALLLHPTSAEAWRSAIERLMSEETLREDLRQKGLQRAEIFSWDRAARETLCLYEEVLARTSKG